MTDLTCLAVGDRVVYRDDAGGVHESTVQWVDGTAAAGVADDMIWRTTNPARITTITTTTTYEGTLL